MRKSPLLFLSVASLSLVAAAPALAQGYSPWSFGATISTDATMSGEFHGGAQTGVVDLSTLDPSLSGTGVLAIRTRDYGDIYDGGIRATVEVRYALSRTTEVFGALSYGQNEGGSTVIGCVLPGPGLDCGPPSLQGTFGDLTQVGVELGYRQWFGIGLFGDRVLPYFAVRGGAVATDAVNLSIDAIGGPNLGTFALYDDSIQAMIGADLGASMAINRNVELGAEIGVRYYTDLKDDDSALGALGLGAINDESDVITVPVSIRLNAVF